MEQTRDGRCVLCGHAVGTEHADGCPIDGRSGHEIASGAPNVVSQ